MAAQVDVVPVTCLGECSVGPFLRLADAYNRELSFAADFRSETAKRARQFAAAEGDVVDDETELVLDRFAATVQPREATRLIRRLAVPAGR